MAKTFTAVLLAAIVCVACSESSGVCPSVPQPGVQLRVVDALSGRSLDSLSMVTVRALFGNRRESSGPLLPSLDPGNPIYALTQQKGSFEIGVRVPTYAEWRDTVFVDQRGCTIIPAKVEARMTRLGGN